MLIRGFARLTRDDAPGRTGFWLLVVVFGIVEEVRHDGLFLLLVRLSGWVDSQSSSSPQTTPPAAKQSSTRVRRTLRAEEGG